MPRPLVLVDADVVGRQRTGDESHVENLLRELGRAESEFSLAALTRYPSHIPPGVRPIELPMTKRSLRTFIGLPRAVRRVHPDLAHFQYVVPPGSGARAVVTVHDISFEFFPRYFPAYERAAFRVLVPRAIRRSAIVFTVSEWMRSAILDRYNIGEDRVVVTPNGVDPAFEPTGERADAGPYVLFVGALQPRKDPGTAVEVLRRLEPEMRLVFVGPDGYAAGELRRRIAEAGLGDRVVHRGYVTKAELAALYRGAECLLFPSRYEGFGLPVLEAMACGTPVVAAAASSVPEVAGDAALLVTPGDPDAFADGVRVAIRDRARLAAAGVERARRYTWAETARKTLEGYRKALAS